MNKLYIILLKVLQKCFAALNSNSKTYYGSNLTLQSNKQYSNDLIYQMLIGPNPLMIARIGSTEMSCILNYWGVNKTANGGRFMKYIKGEIPPWWWQRSVIDQMQRWSGFFPSEIPKLEQFSKLMIQDMTEVDILGSWLNGEKLFDELLSKSFKVKLEDLEPFFTTVPWTKALEGKKVLVVHPFAKTIQLQYKNRKLLFDNDLLPEFELFTIKSVQSIAGEETRFIDWFEALEFMKKQIEDIDFDICIIGAGAYGFPLAAHVKRLGKKAVHLGGATQLLFGIKGRRWDELDIYNQYWVRPSLEETPKGASQVENGCYW